MDAVEPALLREFTLVAKEDSIGLAAGVTSENEGVSCANEGVKKRKTTQWQKLQQWRSSYLPDDEASRSR
jgi:hypothetical protein